MIFSDLIYSNCKMDQFLVVFLILIIYTLLLFIIKKIGWGKKRRCPNCNNCCPDCDCALNRVQRKPADHLKYHISFRIFDFRRYICSNCGWEGLRWEEKFRSDKS
jgi:hypothetical protein